MNFWAGRAVAEALELDIDFSVSSFTGIETDTRSLSDGALFVALAGEHFDGHDFLDEACRRGATAAVVRRGTRTVRGLELVEVDDTLLAYGMLGRFRRRSITGPVVGITGTNGKTSTKEFVRAVLETSWKTHATRLNNNNRVGVPLTILEAPEDTQALVVEAGANEPGEIACLREIIEPTIGVITNVASGHLSGFRSLDGVMEEKLSLLEGVPDAVVGEEPSQLAERARQFSHRVLTAGLSREADVHPAQWTLDERGFGELVFDGRAVRLAIPGVHQMVNATIACGVGTLAGLDSRTAAAMADVTMPHGRCDVIETESLTILDDTYNANPASLQAALELATSLRHDRRLVIVVGTMLELGDQSRLLHRAAAESIVNLRPDLIGSVGEFATAFERISDYPRDRLIMADTVEELSRALRAQLHGGELILLKASRGVGLERAIPHLTEF